MSKMLIQIIGHDRKAMMDLLNKHRIEIIRQTAQILRDTKEYSVDAIVEANQIEQLRELGYEIEVKENIEEIGKARQALVGKGDRFRSQMQK